MYYYNARYYDPDLGRFIQADIMLDGMNRYTYCRNNPIMYNDPTGNNANDFYDELHTNGNVNVDLRDDNTHPYIQSGISRETAQSLQLQSISDLVVQNYGLKVTTTKVNGSCQFYYGALPMFESIDTGNYYVSYALSSIFSTWNLLASGVNFVNDLAYELMMLPDAIWDSTLGGLWGISLTDTMITMDAAGVPVGSVFASGYNYLKNLGISLKAYRFSSTVNHFNALTSSSWKGLLGISKDSLRTLSKSLSEPYKGTTRLGYAYSKHASRRPEIGGAIRGGMDKRHMAGYRHFKNILEGPGKWNTVKVNGKTHLYFYEKRLPDGRGLRLNWDLTFKGFVD